MKKAAIFLLTLLWLAVSPARSEDAMDYFALGLESSMTRKKIEYFTKALELDPGLAAAYEKRGLLYYFQERYGNVIEDFRTYLRFASPKAEAYRMLGLGYLKQGSYEAAIYNLTQAIEMEPKCTAAYASRAEAHRLVGDFDTAIRDSTTAIQLGGDPRSETDAYRTRARVYRKLGLIQLANADVKASWQVDPRTWRFTGSEKPFSTEDLRTLGLINILAISFLFIVLKLRPPGRD